MFFEACSKGDLNKVKQLLKQGADIHTEDDFALRWAVRNGHLEVVKFLVEHGADVRADNDDALISAVYCGHFEVMIYLKRIYSKKYGDKFLCYNCLVLAACATLCKNKLRIGEKNE